MFALMVQAGPDTLELTARYTLVAVGPMIIGAVSIGLPVIAFGNARQPGTPEVLLLLFVAGLVLTVIAAGVAAAFGTPFGLGLMAFGIPIVWTGFGFGIGLVWLANRIKSATVILVVCGAVCVYGALTLALPG